METLLLAGNAPFDLDDLRSRIPVGIDSEIQDKVAGLCRLILKRESQFVAQVGILPGPQRLSGDRLS